ncbi:ABC transporter ATP-binding protein [Caballeronia sp. LZ035]|uniref:ABC transporter ATP-binding protein n=1 Tax=Caballeronia sp. LZ035 TaxID=3038568 RepID=UPI0028573020|nr:ABC transporter ATP-binding protein [Caballeronia sp. LZ035]MDR5760613.1 ABC transporter ATP-binding protein [Caballeronia sp. LZ035]
MKPVEPIVPLVPVAPVLEVQGLTTWLRTPRGIVTAVDNVSLSVAPGRALAIVGESGSGKSMTCLSMLGLLPSNGQVAAGEVRFKGRNLLALSREDMARVRGREIGMILQDAMTSLNPLMTIGSQVAEVFRYQQGIRDRAELRRKTIDVLTRARIPAAQDRLDSYPFQFSGGMRQRVSIAMNIACEPDLLICDEPTTALDVTVQTQIIGLLDTLRRERNMAIVFITHDLHLASQFCDDVAIMYAGRIVEAGPVDRVFAKPVHPYTEGLLRAVPTLGATGERLATIAGQPPVLSDLPAGCRFAPRCAYASALCHERYPDWYEWNEGADSVDPRGERRVACHATEARLQAAWSAS